MYVYNVKHDMTSVKPNWHCR